jgi:hypothetical protein
VTDQPQWTYAVIRNDNTPVIATFSREHAFEECRLLAAPNAISFSGWENGEVCSVTHKGEVAFRIFCLELKS